MTKSTKKPDDRLTSLDEAAFREGVDDVLLLRPLRRLLREFLQRWR